ncbi:uncharacterized protein HaLaN_22407, partial [Haematococcus lacustris]
MSAVSPNAAFDPVAPSWLLASQIQQELRAKRKTGELITEASQRRSAVKQTVAQRKAERKQERDLL